MIGGVPKVRSQGNVPQGAVPRRRRCEHGVAKAAGPQGNVPKAASFWTWRSQGAAPPQGNVPKVRSQGDVVANAGSAPTAPPIASPIMSPRSHPR